MQLIDLHCDTLYKLRTTSGKETLMENDYAISIPGMKAAGTAAQFFACFTYLEETKSFAVSYEQVLTMIRILEEQCRTFSDKIAQAYSREDLEKNQKEGKISAVLTVEEGGILEGEMSRLEYLYKKGVRLITPMWNYENCLGHPNSTDPEKMKLGLTNFGIEAVERCGELGIIVDVSHASDGSFADILQHAKGPVIASHSNCRALCAHPRNLTDEMIHRLSEHGGVSGLNFYGAFLDGSLESRFEAMEAHLRHMIQVGGEDFPAIGTDFDGFDGMTYEDAAKVADMEKLWEHLHKAGFTQRMLDKIWYENACRVMP